MFVVYFADYEDFTIIGAYETKEQAQALINRIDGGKVGLCIEEVKETTLFIYEFYKDAFMRDFRIISVRPYTDDNVNKDRISTSKYSKIGSVIASSYQEAIQKIRNLLRQKHS